VYRIWDAERKALLTPHFTLNMYSRTVNLTGLNLDRYKFINKQQLDNEQQIRETNWGGLIAANPSRESNIP
jgi:hypothetical protein